MIPKKHRRNVSYVLGPTIYHTTIKMARDSGLTYLYVPLMDAVVSITVYNESTNY